MKISLNEKLILYFLTLGLGAIFIISIFSFYGTKKALLNRTFDQLTSLRIVKKHQVELFFIDRVKDISILSESDDTRNMALELERFCRKINDRSTAGDREQLLSGFSVYLKKYRSLRSYFQSISFISGNKVALKGNFRDNPEIEVGTLTSSELKRFDAAAVFEGIGVGDEFIDPRTHQPTMFLSCTLGNSGNLRDDARLVLEIPVDAINTIMLNNNPESGLGQTGETYIVGSDFLMRSASRFQANSVLRTSVQTIPAIESFRQREGSVITRDYRNIPVLSSFSRISVPGLSWAILAEIDVKEAMIPIYSMRNRILFISSLIAIIFFMFVFFIAKRITRPVIELKNAAIRVGQGQYDVNLPIQTHDEIGALTESFNLMAGQIKEKTNELQQERIGRLRSVFDGEEIERQRLSRELHDGIGQYLIALKLRLESLLYSDNSRIKENIQDLKDMFDNTIDEIRRISNNLTPAVLEAFGITIALRNLCQESGEHTGITFHFNSSGKLEDIHTNLKTYLFRISQEAINNIVKHSGATSVEILLTRELSSVTLSIRDNGKGFDTKKASIGEGNGLHNMRERVDMLHGTIDINSFIEKGTTIKVVIPVF